MAKRGVVVWKGLLLGPLLAVVYAAVAPLTMLGGQVAPEAVQTFWIHVLVGLLVGDGVGLGVELVELVWPKHRSPAAGGSVDPVPHGPTEESS